MPSLVDSVGTTAPRSSEQVLERGKSRSHSSLQMAPTSSGAQQSFGNEPKDFRRAQHRRWFVGGIPHSLHRTSKLWGAFARKPELNTWINSDFEKHPYIQANSNLSST